MTDYSFELIKVAKQYEELLKQGLKDCNRMIRAARRIRKDETVEDTAEILDGKVFDCQRNLAELKHAMRDLNENAVDLNNY